MRLTTLSAMVLVLAATLLSACTAPQPSTTEMLILEEDSVTTTQEKIPMQSPTGTTLKTAADFEHIDAQFVTLTTSKGPITFEIFADKVPVTAQNFLNLAKSGFYDGIVFHRVIADFMAQAGDPLTKDPSQQAAWGTGGPGYTIPDEFMAELTHDGPGVVSMANVGRPNTGGSQFFITFEATPWLDGKHTVFGKVTEGLDVLKQITQGDTIVSVTYQ